MKLVHCQGATNRIVLKLLDFDPSLKNLSKLSSLDLSSITNIPLKKATLLLKQFHQINSYNLIQMYERKQISLISILDSRYPPYLRHISNPPVVLFCKGDLSILQNKRMISVVGTRKASKYGYQIVQYIVKPLVNENWVIISGLARGIDTFAHRVAASEKGRTIAVIAGGFDHLYPKENQNLAKMISTKHLLISTYPPYMKPERWMFPERNRIISGLSLGTLVVQASKKSGSLITAQFALEQGREVFTVPASVLSDDFSGNIDLIRDGATIVSSYKDITECLMPIIEE